MPQLALSLLGPFRVTLSDGTVVRFAYDKVRALLAYLATEADRPHRREALAELLWPEQPAATARHSLSQALNKLRQAIDDHNAAPPFLLIGRDTVQLNPLGGATSDVGTFSALIAACAGHAHPQLETCEACARRLEQAVALYRGELLPQLSIAGSAAWEEWALLKREWLQQRALEVLGWLIAFHERRGALVEVVRFAQQQIALDPWREDAYRSAMRALALSGRRAAALRQYEQCRRVLAGELGIEPDEATTRLYEQIRAGELGPQSAGTAENVTAQAARPHHNLPAQSTPFVGREAELARLAVLLANPDCRLITLIGPGGIGKTRLAQQAARARTAAEADGVCWVSLASLRSAQQLAGAIAAALELQLHGRDAFELLQAYMRDRHMLLVLDNVEHLLEGAPLLAALLDAAPGLRLLATSRERLHLHAEWLFEVDGLRVPHHDTVDALDSFSAVQLFVHGALRAQAQLSRGVDELRCIARICRLTGGIPLAIELAAVWVAVLPCDEIAREIARNLDFLASPLRDLPARHRSMRAVFDHSWNLLAERERDVFGRLSVFRGGFERAAAEQIAGASLAGLATLVSKSLLRRSAAGRYEIHELLQQYGAARLDERPAEAQQTRDRHAAYYAAFLAEREPRLRGPGQRAALGEIGAEIENIGLAWYWAAEHHQLGRLARAIDGLWLYYASRGNVKEVEALFDDVARMLRSDTAGSALEPFASPSGELPASPEVEGLASLPGRPEPSDLLLAKLHLGLGSWSFRLGEYRRACSSLEDSITRLRGLDEPRTLAFALNQLAAAVHLQGEYRAEQLLLEESLVLSEATGDRWLAGYSLNDLALCTQLLGDAAEARRLCEASLAVFEAIGDGRGSAYALNNLGLIAAHEADFAEAERLHRLSEAFGRANDDRWAVASALAHLGSLAYTTGRIDEARSQLLGALGMAHRIRALPLVLKVLVELAQLSAGDGAAEQVRALLLSILDHPALTAESRAKSARLLASLPPVGEAEAARARAADLDDLVTSLLAPAANKRE